MATLLSKAERSYIVSGLTARLGASIRQDGRDVHDYRTIGVMTGDGVAPLANGSAKVSVGGTEVVAAVRLEVGDTSSYSSSGGGGGGGGGGVGNDEGRIRCNVTCSPAAYPHLSSNQQDEIQNDLTSLLQSVYSRPTPPHHPSSSSSSSLSFWDQLESNLLILSTGKIRKYWTLHLDAVVLSDAGNLYDVLFLACRGALWDTRVPRTRAVEYRHQRQPDDKGEEEGGRDMWKEAIRSTHKNKRGGVGAADFELEDPSELGRWLIGRERCPAAVTLNILPTAHLVDATHAEEQAIPLKLVLLYSFANDDDEQKASSSALFLGMRLIGPGQVPLEYLKGLLQQGETYAQQLVVAFDAQLTALERSRE
ncbi:hypothetical protein FRC17_002014 [Serendipita sp. 399]|nr:hypothetical protein FRC17_002014 [Serendipita sp. 399]